MNDFGQRCIYRTFKCTRSEKSFMVVEWIGSSSFWASGILFSTGITVPMQHRLYVENKILWDSYKIYWIEKVTKGTKNNIEVAKDLVQDTFIVAVQKSALHWVKNGFRWLNYLKS